MYVVCINLLYFLSIFLFTYNKNLLSQKNEVVSFVYRCSVRTISPGYHSLALFKEHYTPNCRRCKEFNLYFFDTWLTGSYPVPISFVQRFLVPKTTVKDTTHVLPSVL